MRFHIGDILSIAFARLLAPSGIDAVYKILQHLVQQEVYTHQITYWIDKVRPFLFDRFNWLEHIKIPDNFTGKNDVESWVAEQAKLFGEYHDVKPLDVPFLEKNPIQDLIDMRGSSDEILVVFKADN